MAATRLIALHVNKGKTVAQCLADRTDYSQNAAKTNDGEFISSYECDPKTADEEFLLSKRQYQHITGRQQKNNIIAYQIRQSFKPGEITPEEANQVGYETAMRWTKGKHAFIVATHIDKSHIHNHIIYNSTSLDATRKFKNFFLSGLAVQRLSDMVCLEHGLSIITPKPYRERQKRTVYPKKRTQRDELCDAIDAVLKQKPKSFDGFVQALADMGFEFKDGKQPAFKGKNQKRFIRLRSLGEGYSKEEIQAVISGKNLDKSKGSSAKAPAPKQFQMLIDIQAKMAEGKTAGLSLVSLAKIAGEESEYEKAFRFLDAAQEMETLFEESRLGGVNVMVSQMKLGILVKQGKKDQALSELKHLVMGYLNIVQGRKTETPIYFDKLEWNESTSPKRGYLLENLLWLLETEDVYAELRAEDVYREMVEKIQKELEKSR